MDRRIAGFTLIELLIVIGILAVISVVVLLALNPVELLRQARDANRLSDLQALHSALNIYSVDFSSAPLGDPTKIYVSVPDPNLASATGQCSAGMGLLPPPNLTYQCASPSTYTGINGNGWIPIDFRQMPSGAPFSRLPTDPVNTVASGLYYTYVPGGSWALASLLESEKYLKQNAANDEGTNPGKFEIGTNLTLAAKADGLVGYWKFDEGQGTTPSDSSGNNLSGVFDQADPTWVTGKTGSALRFAYDGNAGAWSRVLVANGSNKLDIDTQPYTLEAWIQPQTFIAQGGIISKGSSFNNGFNLSLSTNLLGGIQKILLGRPALSFKLSSLALLSSVTWYHVAGVYEGSGAGRIHINGSLDKAGALSTAASASGANLTIGFNSGGSAGFDGIIDEVKIYNRALSASEIQAIYKATK